MSDKFNSIYKDLLSEDADSYFANVQATVQIDLPEGDAGQFDWESTHKVMITFSMVVEGRSWGIKSIAITPSNISPISINLFKDDKIVKTIEINVDASQIHIEQTPPTNYIGVGEIELYVNLNGVVDYKRSTLVAYGV